VSAAHNKGGRSDGSLAALNTNTVQGRAMDYSEFPTLCHPCQRNAYFAGGFLEYLIREVERECRFSYGWEASSHRNRWLFGWK
jgi:hypothetical protein